MKNGLEYCTNSLMWYFGKEKGTLLGKMSQKKTIYEILTALRKWCSFKVLTTMKTKVYILKVLSTLSIHLQHFILTVVFMYCYHGYIPLLESLICLLTTEPLFSMNQFHSFSALLLSAFYLQPLPLKYTKSKFYKYLLWVMQPSNAKICTFFNVWFLISIYS